MEIFHEIYGNYYYIVETLLREGSKNIFSNKDFIKRLSMLSSAEGFCKIEEKLKNKIWDFFDINSKNEYISKLCMNWSIPLTILQKMWVKSIINDCKMQLFITENDRNEINNYLKDIPPLFKYKDFYFFDQYNDGDNFYSNEYKNNFKIILSAIKEKKLLRIKSLNKNNRTFTGIYKPLKFEYSLKDNKIRLRALKIKSINRVGFSILNLSRILYTEIAESNIKNFETSSKQYKKQSVVLKIFEERNTLERAMLHFANYEKITEYNKHDKSYKCTIFYTIGEETELLIRILSFGPMVQVLGNESFLNQIKQRVKKQTELLYYKKEEVTDEISNE